MTCAIHASNADASGREEDASRIAKYVESLGKTTLNVPGDGHCILYSLFVSLTEEHGVQLDSPSQLFDMMEEEILENLNFYGPFVGDIDLVKQLKFYRDRGLYDQEIVDLCIHALANCTKTSINVIQPLNCDLLNVIVPSSRPGISIHQTIHLVKCNDHYNPVVSIRTKEPFNNANYKRLVIKPFQAGRKIYPDVQPEDVVYVGKTSSSPLPLSNKYAAIADSSDDCDPDSSEDDLASARSSSSDEQAEPMKIVGNRTYLNQSIWEGVQPEVVQRLPRNISGTKIFKVTYQEGTNPMEATNDGRPWGRYVPSTQMGFSGTRRLAKCSGTLKCPNRHCSYLKEFGKANVTQFTSNGQNRTCMHCDKNVERIPCAARKIWEIPRNINTVTVYHFGEHTCTVKHEKKQRKHLQKLKDRFAETPKVTPMQMAFQSVIGTIEREGTWEEIEEVAEEFCDFNAIRNAKKSAAKHKRPHGHSFEAVSILKKKTDMKNPFLIYKANDGSLNGNPRYVFKSSNLRAKMALNMNRHGDHVLSNEYCHFDGKHDRCKNFVTITTSVYHPVLRRMVKLAIMECSTENEEN